VEKKSQKERQRIGLIVDVFGGFTDNYLFNIGTNLEWCMVRMEKSCHLGGFTQRYRRQTQRGAGFLSGARGGADV